MRAKTILLLGAFAVVAGGFSVSSANHCDGSHKSAAGSCKRQTTGWQVECGDEGRLPTPGDIGIHANETDDGAEVEACSDTGAGNQHGRLIVQVSQSEEGARVILDSDPDQPFDPGWITVQVSGKDGNQNGIYCSSEAGPVAGDGYARSWANPGPGSGAECIPDPPF